jgi:hypothetical protein
MSYTAGEAPTATFSEFEYVDLVVMVTGAAVA